ncbi:MAG: hypothetical protein KF781_04185 [Chitinophagaceae bacterium]|nr:hypothetical protein [Chitinophagaceae bacterium]MCW5904715.1 hypothetical protein [Chitinophagaceae bacterium]
MERVGTLINKLKEQLELQQDADKLLLTAQMLVAELQQHEPVLKSGKIAVTMPIASVFVANTEEKEEQKEKPSSSMANTKSKKEEQSGWLFDTALTAIPTLAHQEEIVSKPNNKKEVYELKDMFASENDASLNNALKEEKTEIASKLKGSPVKDLKKAIGINDRYVFINELFRGDEDMYERSIKTINGFSIYPEAEYWIQRELKIKLGWEEVSETVQNFNQLVKRRFS